MGFFSNSNPNEWAGDPNNAFYKIAMANFFNNLRKNLNASSPGTQQLLASQMAQGGDFGRVGPSGASDGFAGVGANHAPVGRTASAARTSVCRHRCARIRPCGG